jgi:uncharacterized protein HemX
MKDESNKAEKATQDFAELDDPNLRDALLEFKASVHGWSDAAYSAARTAPTRPAIARRRTLAWALSLVLASGALSGAVYERHHQQVLAQQQRQRELQLEHQRQMAAQQQQHASEAEDLMAKIDSDVAREVPTAMEPLAQMMTDDGGVQ